MRRAPANRLITTGLDLLCQLPRTAQLRLLHVYKWRGRERDWALLCQWCGYRFLGRRLPTTNTLSAARVASAKASIVLRVAPSTISASATAPASMQLPPQLQEHPKSLFDGKWQDRRLTQARFYTSYRPITYSVRDGRSPRWGPQ